MKHLDLFSGIGGFALAAETVWPDIKHIFCDNDDFSQAILKKHWPEAPIFGDIRTLTAETIGERIAPNTECERLASEQEKQKDQPDSVTFL